MGNQFSHKVVMKVWNKYRKYYIYFSNKAAEHIFYLQWQQMSRKYSPCLDPNEETQDRQLYRRAKDTGNLGFRATTDDGQCGRTWQYLLTDTQLSSTKSENYGEIAKLIEHIPKQMSYLNVTFKIYALYEFYNSSVNKVIRSKRFGQILSLVCINVSWI